jgi:hypothetical protein
VTARLEAARALRDLALDAPLPLRVRGTCMTPALASGQVVEVRAARFYWPGDIVAFATAEGELTVHRAIGWGPASWSRPWSRWGLWTQADGGALPDAPVHRERLIGKLPGRRGLRGRAAACFCLLRHLGRRAACRLGFGERAA